MVAIVVGDVAIPATIPALIERAALTIENINNLYPPFPAALIKSIRDLLLGAFSLARCSTRSESESARPSPVSEGDVGLGSSAPPFI